MSKIGSVLLGVLLVLAFAPTASAGTVTVSDSISKTETEGWPFFGSFALPGFDPASGTLTEVQLTLTATTSGGFTFTNTTFNEGSITSSFFTIVNLNIGVPLVVTPDLGTVNIPLGPRESIVYTFDPDTDSAVTNSTQAGVLGLFTGAGTVNVPMAISFNFGGTISPGITGNKTSTMTTTATLDATYVFTSSQAVPEPSTLARSASERSACSS